MNIEIVGKAARLNANGTIRRHGSAGASRDPLWADLHDGLRRCHLWSNLGWSDIRSRYRRTVIGPFWTVLNTGTMVGALGFVNAVLWHIPISTYLPFFCAGYISWSLLLNIVNESSSSIISAEATIKAIHIPYSVFVFRVLTRNLIVFGHNLSVFILVAVIFGVKLSENTLLLPVGLVLASLNFAWIGLFLGVICVRFRDVIQLLANVLTILFFITPIFWEPSQLDQVPIARLLLSDANFVHHLVDIIRAPLLGHAPEPLSFYYLLITIVVGFTLDWLLLRRFYNRIAYWL